MSADKKKDPSDIWLVLLMVGALLLIAALPFLTLYDVYKKYADLRDWDPDTWMGAAHGAYVLFTGVALWGFGAALRGKIAKDSLSERRKTVINTIAGAVLLAYASPFFLFLLQVDGYIWIVARSLFDFAT